MPVFTACDKETIKLAKEMLHKHHPELEQVDLTVHYLFSHGKDGKPDLKHQGYPAAAVIKINPYEKRVQGLEDVTLKIAARGWKEMSDKARRSLLRHEFLHLTLVKDDQGVVKTDDCGRPRLKLRLHDVQLGIFEQVVEEFGKDGLDAQILADAFARPVVQGVLNWG